MSVKRNIYRLALATVLFVGLPKAASAAVIRQTFDDFQGTFDSVTLLLNDRQVATGEIFASQNPNLPSIVTFDTDTKQATFDLNFLLDFPLLDALEIEPLPISPFETGTYALDGQDLIADVVGQGLVTGFSPFAGTQTFFQVQWRVTSPLDTSVFLGQIESEVVDICLPASGCVQTTGIGVASSNSTPVPEPGAIAGTIVVGAVGWWVKRQRNRRLLLMRQK